LNSKYFLKYFVILIEINKLYVDLTSIKFKMMRKIKYLLGLGLIAGLLFFTNCKDDDPVTDLTAQQLQAQTMKGTWTIVSATVPEGVNPTILNGTTMAFNSDDNYTPTSFTSNGAPDYFNVDPAPGGWDFVGESTTAVSLTNVGPVSEFNINNLTGTTMEITFSHPGLRISDLGGVYTANLTK